MNERDRAFGEGLLTLEQQSLYRRLEQQLCEDQTLTLSEQQALADIARELNAGGQDLHAKVVRLSGERRWDHRTGVLNAESLEQELDKAVWQTHSQAYTHQLSRRLYLRFDANGFKRINDRFDHQVGNDILAIAAQYLRRHLREGDYVGRSGGDEFDILTSEISSSDIPQIVQRILTMMRGFPESQEFAEYVRNGNFENHELLHVTFCGGGTILQPNETSTKAIMRRADDAMYHSKYQFKTEGNLSIEFWNEKLNYSEIRKRMPSLGR